MSLFVFETQGQFPLINRNNTHNQRTSQIVSFRLHPNSWIHQCYHQYFFINFEGKISKFLQNSITSKILSFSKIKFVEMDLN